MGMGYRPGQLIPLDRRSAWGGGRLPLATLALRNVMSVCGRYKSNRSEESTEFMLFDGSALLWLHTHDRNKSQRLADCKEEGLRGNPCYIGSPG